MVGYGWWVGGDFMAYGRFYVVATGLLAALVGWGALRWLLAFVSRGAFLWFAVYCALLGGAFLTFS